eukprot:6181139-Pleurochrysis_carterae.AAC.4
MPLRFVESSWCIILQPIDCMTSPQCVPKLHSAADCARGQRTQLRHTPDEVSHHVRGRDCALAPFESQTSFYGSVSLRAADNFVVFVASRTTSARVVTWPWCTRAGWPHNCADQSRSSRVSMNDTRRFSMRKVVNERSCVHCCFNLYT